MAELIDKKNLFNNLFVRNGKVCPTNDIDNFPITIDVKEVKKAILEQPTTTEAEIRAAAIDEVFEFLKSKRNKYSLEVGLDDLEIRKYKEQLKGENEEC